MRNLLAFVLICAALAGAYAVQVEPAPVSAAPNEPDRELLAGVNELGKIAADLKEENEALREQVRQLKVEFAKFNSCECDTVAQALPETFTEPQSLTTWERPTSGSYRTWHTQDGRPYYEPVASVQSVYQGNCANGQCGTVQRRGLFGRR